VSKKLNYDQPYGTVTGVAGHRFEQDGRYFDAQGNEVVLQAPDEPVVAVRKTATRKTKAPDAAVETGDDQLTEQMLA
jgi:hypothetical protein